MAATTKLLGEHRRKGAVVGDMVFPELALGLVDRHRRAAPEVGALEIRRDLALIERVSELVQRPEQRLQAPALIARGDARVASADCLAERVRRHVDAPAVLADAEPPQRCPNSSALGLDRYADGHRAPLRLPADAGDQRPQALGEAGEDRLNPLCCDAVVEVVKQRVVGSRRIFEARRIGAGELDVARQCRSERREVRVGARRLPRRLPGSRRLRSLADEVCRHAALALEVPPCDADDVAVDLVELTAFQLLEPLADLVGARKLVRDTVERGELVRARGRALGRHHHPLVPPGEPTERR